MIHGSSTSAYVPRSLLTFPRSEGSVTEMTNKKHPGEIPIEIDKRPYKAPKPDMRGDELKALANVPADYQLFLDTPPGQGDDELIPNDKVVHLKPGMKFHSVPPGNVGGGEPTGCPPLDRDLEELRAEGLEPEVHKQPNEWVFLVFPAFTLPAHFSKAVSRLLIKIPPNYRAAKPDMFWLDADVALKAGGMPAGACQESVLGESWVRFSWHLQNWMPDRDRLLTFINFIRARLRQAA